MPPAFRHARGRQVTLQWSRWDRSCSCSQCSAASAMTFHLGVKRSGNRRASLQGQTMAQLGHKKHEELFMITLCIRYTIDPSKSKDFEDYARHWPEPIERCGGRFIGYFLPTKLAGPTDFAMALIDFPNLAAYEQYREAAGERPEAIANVAAADGSKCI